MAEELPVPEKLKVIESFTLYKSEKWWSAIALVESFGKMQVNLYLWLFKDGKWRRKQKYVIRNKEEWSRVKEVVERFVEQIQ